MSYCSKNNQQNVEFKKKMSIVQYPLISRYEVALVENIWRQRVRVCKRNSLRQILWNQLPLHIIDIIADMTNEMFYVKDLQVIDKTEGFYRLVM